MGIFSDVLLTVDFDRTMTAQDHSVPERNLEAVRYFMENGGIFTINTGRSVPMTKVFRDKVPVNAPLLLYNGSAAYDLQEQKLSFMHPIDLDLWTTVRELLETFPHLTVEVQGLDAHYNFIPNPMFDAFSRHNDCAHALAEMDQDIGPFLKFTLYGDFHTELLSDLFDGTPEEIARIDAAEAVLREKYGEKIAIFRAAARIIDVHASGVSKNRSARELQQRLGRKLLVCVGDAPNDISMLDGADFSFVPADAALADQYENVCPCGEGAVADVIYKKIPEILKKYT